MLNARRLKALEAHKQAVAVTPLAHAISPAQKLALIDHARSLRKQYRLNSRCLDLLGALLEAVDGRTGAAWRKVATLAREMDCAPSTVQRTCRRLERADLIRVERIRMRAGDHGASRYWPNWGAIGRDLAVAEAPREKAVVARHVAHEIATTPMRPRAVADRSKNGPQARPAVASRGRNCDHHSSLGIESKDPVGNTIQESGRTETLHRAQEAPSGPNRDSALVASSKREPDVLTRDGLVRLIVLAFQMADGFAASLVDGAIARHGLEQAGCILRQAKALRVHRCRLAAWIASDPPNRVAPDWRTWRNPPLPELDLAALARPWAFGLAAAWPTDRDAEARCRRWAARLSPSSATVLADRLRRVWAAGGWGWEGRGWSMIQATLSGPQRPSVPARSGIGGRVGA